MKELTPEQKKERKSLEDSKMQEVTMAIGKISEKYDKKIKMLAGR